MTKQRNIENRETLRVTEDNLISTTQSFFEVDSNVCTIDSCVYNITTNLHAPINFSFKLEDVYGIEFNDTEISKVNTLSDYFKLIKRKQGRKNNT